MKEKNTKKLELNTKKLDNFDKIMSIKLDEIEELKITTTDNSSKLLNIISLCANVKTIIIEGDQRINSDKILANIFKPQQLENLVLNNVKLPTSKVLQKFSGLKMISLNDIRFCNIKDFFECGFANPENIETINIFNTDMMNISTEILQKFSNIKYLSIKNVTNFNFDKIGFLKDNKNILKIEIINNKIPVNQINDLLKVRGEKNIDIEINGAKEARLQITEEKKVVFSICADELDELSKNINLYKADEINLTMKNAFDTSYYIKMLKKYKAQITIKIANFSCLTGDHAKKIKEILKLETIYIADGQDIKEYKIDEYILMRSQIDEITSKVSKHVTEPEKFLEVYKLLGKKCYISNKNDTAKVQIEETAQVLQNCLQCMNIKSNIIKGNELENDIEHSWNQVKIDGKWYNVDLGLDIENIKKNKAEFCLRSDKDFLDTHIPKSGESNYCGESFNAKLINVYLKTGLFKENLFKSYTELMLEKFKKVFNFNKKQEILLLPSGNCEEDEKI